MRSAIKFRILFLLSAVVCYYLGFEFLPSNFPVDSFAIDSLSIERLFSNQESVDLYMVMIFCLLYFGLLPLLYWFWVIKAGKQKPWKMLLVISLSCVAARFTFPAEIATYFEFIAWLRYPIIAIFLLLEVVVMASLVKGLWQARKAAGDPRVTLLFAEQVKLDSQANEQSVANEEGLESGLNENQQPVSKVPLVASRKQRLKQEFSESRAQARLSLGLTLASEPACWYYAVPYFSRKHVKSEANLALMTAARWHWFAMAAATLGLGVLSYLALYEWSELAAIIVSSLMFYSLIFVTANHRLSRHYSLYLTDEHLVINNTFWGLTLVPLVEIKSYRAVDSSSKPDAQLDQDVPQEVEKERLQLGRGRDANIELIFNSPITYHGAMAQLPESWSQIALVVDSPTAFIAMLDKKIASISSSVEHAPAVSGVHNHGQDDGLSMVTDAV